MNPMDIDNVVPATSAAALPRATRGPVRLGKLLNPYFTRADSRQLDETIANPHVRLEYYRQQQDLDALKRQGQGLLDRYCERKTPGNAFLPRRVSAELEKEIAELVKATGIVGGKALVANATANNRLGTGAKIATAREEEGDRYRLICVYTRDFTDKEDVECVLLQLVRMEFMPAEKSGSKIKGKGIHYKCDVYTHLDIYAGNGLSFTSKPPPRIRMLSKWHATLRFISAPLVQTLLQKLSAP
ncbi:hypothetical protein B0H17DRAFT_1133638 [Mycena rosella]|uniref:Uncharacterized protein n=1 Tax=Mycena rosella TaxID=1033263 RepID=A0AAD7GK08_MYCRO|nr:hypothetical protein B0H17DRAFT_1133638 [Mycena rosella]